MPTDTHTIINRYSSKKKIRKEGREGNTDRKTNQKGLERTQRLEAFATLVKTAHNS